jgi:hypothetical protein
VSVSKLEAELTSYREAVAQLAGCNFIQAYDAVKDTTVEQPVVRLIETMTRLINRSSMLEDTLESYDIEAPE